MKQKYITPLTCFIEIEANLVMAGSFDAKYGYENNGFFSEHGGGEQEGYTSGNVINWAGDETIDPNDMYARGFSFGSFWE